MILNHQILENKKPSDYLRNNLIFCFSSALMQKSRNIGLKSTLKKPKIFPLSYLLHKKVSGIHQIHTGVSEGDPELGIINHEQHLKLLVIIEEHSIFHPYFPESNFYHINIFGGFSKKSSDYLENYFFKGRATNFLQGNVRVKPIKENRQSQQIQQGITIPTELEYSLIQQLLQRLLLVESLFVIKFHISMSFISSYFSTNINIFGGFQ